MGKDLERSKDGRMDSVKDDNYGYEKSDGVDDGY
jgi:hypothetical protein